MLLRKLPPENYDNLRSVVLVYPHDQMSHRGRVAMALRGTDLHATVKEKTAFIQIFLNALCFNLPSLIFEMNE